ncbi:MAG: TonB-dependent receptor [Betaproteobacteria bacterium]|uniref:TonB-dependent receptor n=1 Tax=Candidatus Proximibacter danicus TaxID=2954365 RepID=A0A9D7PRA0_9PROT|nr:TonB-dependent receptor [Candidatus Proximibacter danicus]
MAAGQGADTDRRPAREHCRASKAKAASSASQLAPSLAGRFDSAPDLILRSSIGTGIKAPKLEEISGLTVRGAGFNSPLEADRGGNATLQAERNLNWELALDKHLPNETGTLGANLYVRRTEDFIERRTALEGTRWVDRPYNEGTARHWGLEFDAKLKGDAFGWKGAALRSHLTLPKARVEDERLGLTRDARPAALPVDARRDQACPCGRCRAGFYNQSTADRIPTSPANWPTPEGPGRCSTSMPRRR